MTQPNIICSVCQGSEFTLHEGSFFCLECNTQSQDVREEVYDEYTGNQKISSRVLQKKTPSTTLPGHSKKLTSWEILNYVLKGITDELIVLGAKPELKIVTLQLWASYLRGLEIAFTSVDVERKPKLGYAFKQSDAELIYGVTEKQLKEKSWRSRSRSSFGTSSSSNSDGEGSTSTPAANQSRRSILRKLAFRKKALASAEYMQLSQEMTPTPSQSQNLEDLDSSSGTGDTPKKIKITKRAKSLLNASLASTTDDERSVRKRLARSEVQSLRNVTTAKVVALVNIALAITHQDIQVSDFLRWMEEGHISLGKSRKFLPEDLKIDGQTQRTIEIDHLSYVKCQNLITGMCHELGIAALPDPDLGRLADRYCLELQLPQEMVTMVKRLLVLSTNQGTLGSYRSAVHSSRHCEVQVMAAIVIVMKLLFSLDDYTEYRLSHTVSEINRVAREEGESKRMFVFSEWMHFIECRKAVLSSCHMPTRMAVYGDTMGRDPELFLQHYAQTAGKLPDKRELKKRYALNKNWVEAMCRCLQMLVKDQSENSGITFPASLTPLHSGTQMLLSLHAERVAPARAVLQQDFTNHSLEYIIAPDQTVAVGLTRDLNIVQKDGTAAIFQIGNLSSKDDDSLVIPKYGLNQVNYTVKVVKNINVDEAITENKADDLNLVENLLTSFKEIISDDSDDEDEDEDAESGFCDTPKNQTVATCQTTLELFNTSSQYWFCHDKNNTSKKASMESFETFAMNNLPTSFLWLLKECARVIGISAKELYTDVVSIECKHKNIINESLRFTCGLVRKGNKRKNP